MYITQDEMNSLKDEEIIEAINLFAGEILATAKHDRMQAMRYCNTVNYLTNTLRERVDKYKLTSNPFPYIM